jgi:hypothetical protein
LGGLDSSVYLESPELNNENPLKNLVIRTASVQSRDTGFIIACELEKEREGVQHAFVFKWSGGEFRTGRRSYDAHSMCQVEKPDIGHVDLSSEGYYALSLRSSKSSGIIFEDCESVVKERRVASFRSVAAIAGTAYAIGLRGLIYRLDDVKNWTRIDEGLPATFDGQAIHGYGASDIYAVGRRGSLWHYNGRQWVRHDLPTSENLTSIQCATDGNVYVAGHKGILIRGRGTTWEIIDHGELDDDIWDIAWFDQRIFVSTMKTVYQLQSSSLLPVKFDNDPPKSCYQLSTAEGVMWSNGEFDIMSFDGKQWTRIV